MNEQDREQLLNDCSKRIKAIRCLMSEYRSDDILKSLAEMLRIEANTIDQLVD